VIARRDRNQLRNTSPVRDVMPQNAHKKVAQWIASSVL